jgi:predicted phage tail protein
MMIRRTARVILPILRVSGEDPELAKKMIAEQKTQMALEQLGRQYRNSTDPKEREQLKARIREQMALRSDMRLERLRNEIRNLQRRLDEAKEDLADQEKNKQALIDKKLEAFLSAPEDEHEHHHRHGRFGEDRPATRPE